jgi:hypothetical protein
MVNLQISLLCSYLECAKDITLGKTNGTSSGECPPRNCRLSRGEKVDQKIAGMVIISLVSTI